MHPSHQVPPAASTVAKTTLPQATLPPAISLFRHHPARRPFSWRIVDEAILKAQRATDGSATSREQA